MNRKPRQPPRIDDPAEGEPWRQRLAVASDLPLEIRRLDLGRDRRIRVRVLREVLQLAAVVRVQLVLRQHDFGGRRRPEPSAMLESSK